MTLWSDDKTNQEIQRLAESDSSSVAYNLHEDLLCVKEDLAKANERVKSLELIAKGLCYPEGTVRSEKAYEEWLEYQEQLRKEQE